MASLFRPKSITYKLNGKTRTPDGERVTSKTPGAVKEVKRSAMWWGKYKAADGSYPKVPLCSDKVASKQMLAKLVIDAKLDQHGLGDAFEEQRKRPLCEHLADFKADLLARGVSAKHVRDTVGCVRRLLNACGFLFMADLSASRVQAFVGELREQAGPAVTLDPGKAWYTRDELAKVLGVKTSAIPPAVKRHRLDAIGKGKARRYPQQTAAALLALRRRGRSIKTANLHLAAVKQFSRWLVRDRRMADDPLAHLAGGNVQLDRRLDRRALPPEELTAILQSALARDRVFRGLSGRDRHHLYLTAMTTGFRAEELASLVPEFFALDATPTTVTLPAGCAKNKKTAEQPLPPDVTSALQEYLRDKPAGQPLWPGTWYQKAAEMLRIELDACGIPYAIEGPDGPLYADFHALRHSYIALLDRSGATLKEAMQLARHSDPKLTTAVYGRAQLHDLAGVVGGLPSLLPNTGPGSEALAATGTDGAAAPRPRRDQNAALRCQSVRVIESVDDHRPSGDPVRKPVELQALESDCERMRATPRGCLNSIQVSSSVEPYRSIGYVVRLSSRFSPGTSFRMPSRNRNWPQRNAAIRSSSPDITSRCSTPASSRTGRRSPATSGSAEPG